MNIHSAIFYTIYKTALFCIFERLRYSSTRLNHRVGTKLCRSKLDTILNYSSFNSALNIVLPTTSRDLFPWTVPLNYFNGIIYLVVSKIVYIINSWLQKEPGWSRVAPFSKENISSFNRIWVDSFLASGEFCHPLIAFASSLDPDHDQHNISPDLDLNHLTLW